MSERAAHEAEALSNIFYQTSRTKRAFKALTEVVERGWERNYCKATRLFGPPGVGKSHVLTYFDQIVCRDRGWNMVTIEVMAGSNPRKFGEQVLFKLGDPCPEHGSEDDKLQRAHEAIEKQRINVIALEEVQFLIDDRTDKVNHAVGRWITSFLNRRACPLILSGELSSERLLAGNKMLAQRTFPGCVLKPYDWANAVDRRELRETLYAIDRQLGLPDQSGLAQLDLAQRIFAFSEGTLRPAANLIDKARAEARDRGLPKITFEVLADMADEFLLVDPAARVNPFRTDLVPGSLAEIAESADTAESFVAVPKISGKGSRLLEIEP